MIRRVSWRKAASRAHSIRREIRLLPMSEITCSRCGQTREQLSGPPLPSELGAKIFESICQECWREWLRAQTAIINHYALNLLDPKAKQFLVKQTEVFLFGQPQA